MDRTKIIISVEPGLFEANPRLIALGQFIAQFLEEDEQMCILLTTFELQPTSRAYQAAGLAAAAAIFAHEIGTENRS